jgi:DNA-binding NtrC family response regulator
LNQSSDRAASFGGVSFVGESLAIVLMRERVRRIAATDATVLVEGETGTGKELVARAIHYLSPRHANPFVPVNCGGLPETLAENELFGHERGAFTDARQRSQGLIADAAGGTLFLDEIEAMSPRTQVSLLRFLQDGVYRPLGARKPVHCDVRVLAASNVNVQQLVRENRFREDLMYRLRILTVELPPLRERAGDIPRLVEHFLCKLAKQYRCACKTVRPELMGALCRHSWPGNIRELENMLHRAFLYSDGSELTINEPEILASAACTDHREGRYEVPLHLTFNVAKAHAIERFERAYVTHALERSGGNVSAAARDAGKERRAFGKLIKKYGISKQPA